MDVTSQLEVVLPDTHPFKLVDLKNNSESDFSTIIRLQCQSREEFEKWLINFQAKNYSQWNVRKTVPNPIKFEFRRFYVCHHSHFMKKDTAPGIRSKDTNCLAKMDVMVKKVTVNTKKKDSFVKEGFPTVVQLFWCHNHQLKSIEALSHRRMTKEVENIFWGYFSSEMDVAAAKKFYKSKLIEKPNFSEIMLSDSSIFPTDDQLHFLHRKWRIVNRGVRSVSEMAQVSDVDVQESDVDSAATGLDGSARWTELSEKFLQIGRSRFLESGRDPNLLEAFETFVKRVECTTTPSAFASLLASSSKSLADNKRRSGTGTKNWPQSVGRRTSKRKRKEFVEFENEEDNENETE